MELVSAEEKKTLLSSVNIYFIIQIEKLLRVKEGPIKNYKRIVSVKPE